ncbi:hypothetical protein Tel_07415 [Candidatus Tenderia electrophaga]|jgi:hypothetical protein|uniref:Uncharacterized protein n=1 Tax=Candidatus Tenderia electrophaga TaxID=1748243 RepID=A0A0S2TCX0_9GAMM|nr:hypothetical protein Tel_07415 [Candidatus Tenderia electrophaga]
MSTKLKLLTAVLIGLAIFTLWPGGEADQSSSSMRVWNAHLDAQGRLHVLGVVLGQSTLKQAEAALHSQSERALFVQVERPAGAQETLEAFFPTSPDRAKIVIELDAAPELIDRIKAQAHRPMAFPSGNIKMQIAPEHRGAVDASIVKSLTYIPPISLAPALIERQFGQPGERRRDADGNLHLLYPRLGLDVVVPPQDKPLLQFVPPDQFDRLLSLLDEASDITGGQ